MSLDETLSKLISSDSETPIDICNTLLTPENIIMHCNTKNPKVLNRLKLMIAITEKDNPEECIIWETLYNARNLHSISEDRARAKEVVEIAKAERINQLMQPIDTPMGKKGLFGRR